MAHEVSPQFIKNMKYVLLYSVAGMFMVTGIMWSSSFSEIFRGLYLINVSPSLLLTDYVAVGGIGAALWNAALIILLELLMIKLSHSRLTGALMAAVLLTSGFALFGTNIFNSLPIFLGAFLFARIAEQPPAGVLLQALFTTALGPLVSIVSFYSPLPLYAAIPLGWFLGILCGMIMPPLSSAFLHFHQGYSLYNVGFAAGVIGMSFVALFRLFDYDVTSVNILSGTEAVHLTELLTVVFLVMMLFGTLLNGSTLKGYARLLRSTGRLVTDFDTLYGSGLSFFNMGLQGIVCLIYIYLTRAPINGPVVGAILSVVGFSAMGKHPRNSIPILAGVYLATLISPMPQASTSAVITALFATGLAPIAGDFGAAAGIAAGFLHTALARNILIVHGGVNLYNNGFSTGFVAAVLYPLLSFLRERRAVSLENKSRGKRR